MPEVVDGPKKSSRFSLNSDGNQHPVENILALVAFVCGLIALIMGLIHPTHLIGAWLGLATFALGLYSQMVSATTAQRFFSVIGLTAAFVGMGLAVAHGGFVP